MFTVVKRDGSKAEFSLSKISSAVKKAFDATQVQYNQDIIDLLSLMSQIKSQHKHPLSSS